MARNSEPFSWLGVIVITLSTGLCGRQQYEVREDLNHAQTPFESAIGRVGEERFLFGPIQQVAHHHKGVRNDA